MIRRDRPSGRPWGEVGSNRRMSSLLAHPPDYDATDVTLNGRAPVGQLRARLNRTAEPVPLYTICCNR
jgi:hypothetical protein